ncbi:MAG: hypothetical protein ACTHL3_00645 [Candidatus Nitrosocosmicus sp.]
MDGGENHWNKVYTSHNTFIGNAPSSFVIFVLIIKDQTKYKKILDQGACHGRDSIFFALKGYELGAIDYSVVVVEILGKIAKEKDY